MEATCCGWCDAVWALAWEEESLQSQLKEHRCSYASASLALVLEVGGSPFVSASEEECISCDGVGLLKLYVHLYGEHLIV